MANSTDLLPTNRDAMTDAVAVTAPVRRRSAAKRLVQRGMTTAEYAVGILAAVAFALLLLRIFNDNAIFKMLFDYVANLIEHFASLI